MLTMQSSFLWPRQGTTRIAFCNYLESEVEALVDRDIQTFRNKAVRLLSRIQSRAEKRSCLPQQPQQHTLSRSSSATSTFVPQTFQQPQQPAPAAREYILTIPETQMPASKIIKPAKQKPSRNQRQNREQPTSFVVVDDQQPEPARLITFTLTLMKHFNPPPVASAPGKESQHNISRPSGFFGNIIISDELPIDRHTTAIFIN